ncbi:MAG: UbiX family flavin prenyltransferase [Planctomycetaceae bacterium]|nr:UbiX family flavin prenyltransferase [Planctomycetaceae bacterium]
MNQHKPVSDVIVLAITGASGTAYAIRLAQVLLQSDIQLHLVMSGAARQVAHREIASTPPGDNSSLDEWRQFFATALTTGHCGRWGFRSVDGISCGSSPGGSLVVHEPNDYSAGIASGSFRTRGMVICPCSMGTLSSIACGASTNLIQRAADVHLKERRPLLLAPRETPLSTIAIDNMHRLSQAGATILPMMPGFYHQPSSIGDLIDFIVARICDQLGVDHTLSHRWGLDSQDA